MAPLFRFVTAIGDVRPASVAKVDPHYLFLIAILALELALALHHDLAVTADVHVLGVLKVHRLPGHHGLQGSGLLLLGEGLAIRPFAELDRGLEPLVHLFGHLPDCLQKLTLLKRHPASP